MRGSKTETSPGVWRLRVYVGKRPNGSPIFKAKTVHTGDGQPGSGSRTADRELAKIVADVAKGNIAMGTDTVETLVDRWLDAIEPDRSPTTMKKYREIAKRDVIPEIGAIKLNRLSAQHLDRLYAKLSKRGNQPSTVRRVHALIHAALHQAEKWDLVDNNVARKASPPRVHATEVTPPTPKEVLALIDAAEEVEPMMATMILIAALTGARRGELCGLRWSDFNAKTGTLIVERSVYEIHGGGFATKPTKTHQARTIHLDQLGLDALKRMRTSVEALSNVLGLEVDPDAFIFSRSPQGLQPVRPEVVTKFFTRISKSAKVKTHIHALRHFSATQAIAAGSDIVTVSKRLGHRDSSVTLRVYAHASAGRDQEAANAIGAVLGLGTANGSQRPDPLADGPAASN